MPSLRGAYLRHSSWYAQRMRSISEEYEQGGNKAPVALDEFEGEWVQLAQGQAWAASYAEEDDEAAEIAFIYSITTEILISRRTSEEIIHWLAPRLVYIHKFQRDDLLGEYWQSWALAHYLKGDYQTAIQSCEQAIEFARREQDHYGELAGLNTIGSTYIALNKYLLAIEYLSQALEIAQSLQGTEDLSRTLGNLGIAYAESDDYETAIQYYEQALTMAKTAENAELAGLWLGNLANTYSDLGHYEQAVSNLTEALEVAQARGDKREMAMRLGNLSTAYEGLARYEAAIDYRRRSLDLYREMQDTRGIGIALDGLGRLDLMLENFDQAIQFFQMAKESFTQINLPNLMGQMDEKITRSKMLKHISTAVALSRQEDYPAAFDAYRDAYQLARELGDRRKESLCLGDMGFIYFVVEEYEQAVKFYERALEISRDIDDVKLQINQLGNLGNIYHVQDELEMAEKYYAEAREIATRKGYSQQTADLVANLADIHERLGYPEQALTELEEALAFFEASGKEASIVQIQQRIAHLRGNAPGSSES